ncbi:MAG: tRNA (N6-isopentenyl adenosine(37)-C2)-methylthiotransferase MiaB [Gammaproteobacteria bacterium]|nr:tRNA (N6-isopentenyl adenosine(37)-C2)-methylthiotransferase MiaB [Gammaproteobacteria bacterium]
MRKTVFIRTFGCQMNDYDSRRIADLLEATHGLRRVERPEEAGLLLLNTCSIREKAQEKLFSELGRFRELQEADKSVVSGVGGCVASQEGEAIFARAPYVNLVFGPQTLHRVPELLQRTLTERRQAIDISFPEIEKFDRLPDPRVDGPAAFLSVMEGCSKYCSYCVVPYTRGEEYSRPFDDVLAEAVHLARHGVRELTLLGQNVNAYRGRTHTGRIADLAALLHYLAAIDGLERLRFTTSHPVEFSPRLVDAYRTVPELAGQLHLPVQSGSDRILGAMKRGHTVADYLQLVAALRQARPELSLSTDLIVGFPGETEQDFAATLALVEQVRFDNAFSFIFSARPGTPAADLPDPVPQAEKLQRLERLQRRIREFADDYSRRMVGTTQRVLVTGNARRNPRELSGCTENNRVINFAGPLALIGEFVAVEVTTALANTLRGRLSSQLEHAC